MQKKNVLACSLFLALSAAAVAHTEGEQMFVETAISQGQTQLRLESGAKAISARDRALLGEIDGIIRGCGGGDLKTCGPPEIVQLIREVCGGVQRVIIRPKRGVSGAYLVSTGDSTTEVTEVSSERPIRLYKTILGPPLEGGGGNAILHCGQRFEGAGLPDVNSVHCLEVCHDFNGERTCANASVDANGHNTGIPGAEPCKL